jgi:hypothetical protein
MRTYDVDTKVTISISTATVAKVIVASAVTSVFMGVTAILVRSITKDLNEVIGKKKLRKGEDTWASATNGKETPEDWLKAETQPVVDEELAGKEGGKDAVHEDHKGRKQR